MQNDRWQVLQALFDRARALHGDARERLLHDYRATDPELAAELEALLAADAQPGMLDVLGARFASISDVLVEQRPERIGAYRVVGELGRGGMGTVYLAERADGQYDQRVAIKLIPSSDPGDPLHQRFIAERQILAGLVHPNIARLLDGGITEDGRPYLVMERVDGMPITLYCDQHRLDIRRRLELFADVCAAVQYAHQCLVIHRDLKPGNILVSNDGRVHLLDFGIAKLIHPAMGAARAPQTRAEFRVMTPEYASPEQVRGDSPTTVSDIYSLGVLLYELLCGQAPYQLTDSSPARVIAAVCEHDPEPPSLRVLRGEAGTHATVERIAAARATTVDRLARQLRGDLDSIVMMAMRKETDLRYASAHLLRADVMRYLNGLPVSAHRGSRRYRLQKLIRRHRIEAGAAMVVLATLVGALAVSLAQGRIAARERDRAKQALAQSQSVTDFLMELFRTGDGGTNEGVAQLSALDLLERGRLRANELAGQPVVQARLLDVIGQMSLHLGRYDDAQHLLENAVAIRRAALGPHSPDLAASLIHLSWVFRDRNEFEAARRLVAEALEIRRSALAPKSELADALRELGWVTVGKVQEGYYRQALEMLPDSAATAERRVILLQALSTNLRRQGRYDEAIAMDRAALRSAQRAFGPVHHTTGHAMIHLGDQVRDLAQQPAQAEQLYRRGLDLIARRFGSGSVRLIHGLHSLGILLAERGDQEAEHLFRRSLEIRRTATGPEHPDVADDLQLLASELARQRRHREAETLAREALALSARTLGKSHRVVTNARMPLLAEILNHQGRTREADSLYAAALVLTETAGAPLGELHRGYGLLLLRQGNHARAEKQLLTSLALLEENYGGAEHANVQQTKRALMELYDRWGKPELAERYRVPPGRFIPY